ncbi:hypothetical protein [Sphingomonas sp.]|uniref:hypothetical protein n=1 Tax=Sphingomonas sp. TaxID=28214 RepID=UPI002FC8CB4D
MKRSAILLLLVCAAALPAAAFAQAEVGVEADTEASGESVEMLTTKWSLNKPRKKKAVTMNQALHTANWRIEQPRKKALQTASVAGPALPAARSVKLPRQKKKPKSQQRLPNNRTNAAKAIAKVIRE